MQWNQIYYIITLVLIKRNINIKRNILQLFDN